MPQSWDMGQILSLPFPRKACGGFFRCPKNPTTSAGFEPANSGTRTPKQPGSGVTEGLLVCCKSRTAFPHLKSEGDGNRLHVSSSKFMITTASVGDLGAGEVNKGLILHEQK